jgi:hypothetical protein
LQHCPSPNTRAHALRFVDTQVDAHKLIIEAFGEFKPSGFKDIKNHLVNHRLLFDTQLGPGRQRDTKTGESKHRELKNDEVRHLPPPLPPLPRIPMHGLQRVLTVRATVPLP